MLERAQQVAPPLTHLKAASTYTTCRESHQELTQKRTKIIKCVAFVAQLLIGIWWTKN